MFDAVVISGEVGMRKPEPEIFAHTLDLLGADGGRDACSSTTCAQRRRGGRARASSVCTTRYAIDGRRAGRAVRRAAACQAARCPMFAGSGGEEQE